MSELYWLTDAQVERLKPFFPKSRGRPRVDDRKVLNGIIFIQRNGLIWKHAPQPMARRRHFTPVGSGGAGWAFSPRS